MEAELRANLDTLAATYGQLCELSRTAVAERAFKDKSFFQRLTKTDGSFTIRKYDEVLRWFAANWPDGAEWPAGIPRPERDQAAA